MAKRKRTAKRRTSVGFLRTTRRRSSSVGSSASPIKTIAYGFGYGVARNPVLGLLSPVLSKLNLGAYESSVAMGIVSYMAIKKGSGMVREVGKAGLYVESAIIGQTMNPLTQIGNIITL